MHLVSFTHEESKSFCMVLVIFLTLGCLEGNQLYPFELFHNSPDGLSAYWDTGPIRNMILTYDLLTLHR